MLIVSLNINFNALSELSILGVLKFKQVAEKAEKITNETKELAKLVALDRLRHLIQQQTTSYLILGASDEPDFSVEIDFDLEVRKTVGILQEMEILDEEIKIITYEYRKFKISQNLEKLRNQLDDGNCIIYNSTIKFLPQQN